MPVGLQPGGVLAGGPGRLGGGRRPHARQLSHPAGQARPPAERDEQRAAGLRRAECRGGAPGEATCSFTEAHPPSGRGG